MEMAACHCTAIYRRAGKPRTDKGVSGEGAWRIVPVTDEQLAEAEASKGRDNLIIALAKYENLTDGAEVGPEIGKPEYLRPLLYLPSSWSY